MKKFITILLVIVIIIACIIFIPKLVHTCDDCDEFFVGVGYEPNKLSEIFTEDMTIICKDCAEVHHALSLALGKDLDEYQKELFE